MKASSVSPKEKDGRIERKIYLDEYQGQPIQNLWTDIFVINPVAQERLDYPTQKPESLIERIVKTKEKTCKKHLLLCRFLASKAAQTFNRILREIIPVLHTHCIILCSLYWHVDFLIKNFLVFLIVFLSNWLGDYFLMITLKLNKCL